jgi:hypothetical protein
MMAYRLGNIGGDLHLPMSTAEEKPPETAKDPGALRQNGTTLSLFQNWHILSHFRCPGIEAPM